jgi:WD40 repeat protein
LAESVEETKNSTFIERIPLSQRLLTEDINIYQQPNINSFLTQKRLGDLVRQSIKHSKTLYPTTLVSSLKKLHTGPITLLKVSGDYQSIVTSGQDKVLQVYDLNSSNVRASLKLYDKMSAATFSPDCE